MHCKQVRNDGGYWQEVENFVEDHSEAAFSHGICPDCMKKHHPELLEKMEQAAPQGAEAPEPAPAALSHLQAEAAALWHERKPDAEE